MLSQFLSPYFTTPLSPHAVRYQLFVALFSLSSLSTPPLLPPHHHRFLHSLMLPQPSLNLSQLNPISPHLHLLVLPPQIFQFPIPQVPSSISRSVQSVSLTKWIRSEPLSRHSSLPYIPARQSLSSYIDLSLHSHRHRFQPLIQHIHLHVPQRPPIGTRFLAPLLPLSSSPSPSSCPVASAPTSDDPYRFNIRHPDNSSLISRHKSSPTVSPLSTHFRKLFSSSPSASPIIARANDGTPTSLVTCSRSINFTNPLASRASSSPATTSFHPFSNGTHTSATASTNPNDVF